MVSPVSQVGVRSVSSRGTDVQGNAGVLVCRGSSSPSLSSAKLEGLRAGGGGGVVLLADWLPRRPVSGTYIPSPSTDFLHHGRWLLPKAKGCVAVVGDGPPPPADPYRVAALLKAFGSHHHHHQFWLCESHGMAG